MSNSVVKVTDVMLNDSLLLLVGDDGTVSPSKDVIEQYLKEKTTSTDLQVMHISKSDEQGVEVSIDSMLYVPDAEDNISKEDNSENINFTEIANNLYNIRLDHDYTPHIEPPEEVDELAKTLSILDGNEEPNVKEVKKQNDSKINEGTKDLKLKTTYMHTPTKGNKNVVKKIKTRAKCYQDDEDYNEQEEEDSDNDWNDNKQKKFKKATKQQDIKFKTDKDKLKLFKPSKYIKDELESPKINTTPTPDTKKHIKREKKIPKPIPNDLALFSTPDIIRRVGGKEVSSTHFTTSPESTDSKPAKIERSRSVSESAQSSIKHNRLSLDSKTTDKSGKLELKQRERKSFDGKVKNKNLDIMQKKPFESSKPSLVLDTKTEDIIANEENMSTDAVDENKSLNSNLSLGSNDLGSSDNNLPLDASGLDLDPTLLENINNDLISEDILYQVAQSLVSNTELQNAIDKSLNEENLGLEPEVEPVMDQKQEKNLHYNPIQEESTSVAQRGTQIVRPDGRIVVIPPIERPTTRSRNKKQDMEKQNLK